MVNHGFASDIGLITDSTQPSVMQMNKVIMLFGTFPNRRLTGSSKIPSYLLSPLESVAWPIICVAKMANLRSADTTDTAI